MDWIKTSYILFLRLLKKPFKFFLTNFTIMVIRPFALIQPKAGASFKVIGQASIIPS